MNDKVVEKQMPSAMCHHVPCVLYLIYASKGHVLHSFPFVNLSIIIIIIIGIILINVLYDYKY